LSETTLQGSEGKSALQTYPSIWAFIVLDSVIFGVFFLVFMVERLAQPGLFSASAKHLDPWLGFVNTLILISGSLLVALAVNAHRRGQGERVTRRLLVAAIAVSSCFGLIKITEYAEKFGSGITLVTNDFFTLYFALTGLHFVHYLFGMVVLAYLAWGTSSREATDPRFAIWLESGGLFWHFVDLLWIFLFSMLYLLW